MYEDRLADLDQQRQATSGSNSDGLRRVMAQITRLRTERGVAERLGPSATPRFANPEVQAISLGAGCTVLGLPGEFFVETALAIRRNLQLPHLVVACYANHYIGYVVPRHAFDEGGYEAGVTVLDESAEETLRLAAIEMLVEIGE